MQVKGHPMQLGYVRKAMAGLVVIAATLSTLVGVQPANASVQAFTYWQFRNANSSKCLDVAGTENRAPIQQAVCNGTVNQQWITSPTGSGSFYLGVASSGRCITADQQLSDVYSFDCFGGLSQRWRENGLTWQNDLTGACITIADDSTGDRVRAIQADCSRRSATWMKSEWANYSRFSNLFGQCLDVAGRASGSLVQIFTCNDSVNQQWAKRPTDQGYFTLSVASSGRCLQVPDGSQLDDAILNIADCTGALNQQWQQSVDIGAGSARWIFNRNGGKCLGILAEGRADRTPVVQHKCSHDLLSQIWNEY